MLNRRLFWGVLSLELLNARQAQCRYLNGEIQSAGTSHNMSKS